MALIISPLNYVFSKILYWKNELFSSIDESEENVSILQPISNCVIFIFNKMLEVIEIILTLAYFILKAVHGLITYITQLPTENPAQSQETVSARMLKIRGIFTDFQWSVYLMGSVLFFGYFVYSLWEKKLEEHCCTKARKEFERNRHTQPLDLAKEEENRTDTRDLTYYSKSDGDDVDTEINNSTPRNIDGRGDDKFEDYAEDILLMSNYAKSPTEESEFSQIELENWDKNQEFQLNRYFEVAQILGDIDVSHFSQDDHDDLLSDDIGTHRC